MIEGEPSPDKGHQVAGLLVVQIATAVTGAVLVHLWFSAGPGSPFFALAVAGWTFGLGMAVVPLALWLPRRLFDVPRAERYLHLLLGVPLFGLLLDWSGWNRHVALPMRDLKVTRVSLARLLTNIHAAEGGHAIAFVPHLVLALLALTTGHPRGALWLLLPGIVLHLYPVLLQRWTTLRVAPLVRRNQCRS